jgi:predicted nuclease of predicted toxin-antitoxin system
MAGRFKLDENLPRDAQALLFAAGHDVETAIEEHLAGNPDAKVLDACCAESRVLVTLDLDFADIRLYPPSTHAGVWVLRPATQSIKNTLSVLKGALALLVRSRSRAAFGL